MSYQNSLYFKTIAMLPTPIRIQDQEIAFVGVGVIAQFFAHALMTGGAHKLSLITAHSQQLQGGITVEGKKVAPTYHVVNDSKSLTTNPDIVFITCQAGDSEKLIALKNSGKVGPNTLLVVAQNGLKPEQTIMDIFPDNPVAGMIISAQIRYENEPDGKTLPKILVPKQVKYEIGLTQGGLHNSQVLQDLSDFLNANGLTKVQVLNPADFMEARFMKHFKNMRNLASFRVAKESKTPATYQDGLDDAKAKEEADTAILELYTLYLKHHEILGTLPVPFANILETTIGYATTTHIPTTSANYHARKPIESLTQPILQMAKQLGIPESDFPTIVRFDSEFNAYNFSSPHNETRPLNSGGL
ncbi:MAG: hypothetical protein EXS67_06545 [Candidatus Margulisbacteria bacterium]|nr:hypothetical protein [Candidatus Margulisiibacteriota bacterium]